MCVIQQLPYLPELALADFSLFLKVKLALKGGQFSNISDTQCCGTEPVKRGFIAELPAWIAGCTNNLSIV